MQKIKAVFNWSGGKDSAHALLKVINEGIYDIAALLTTVNRDTGKSALHGIPLRLLERQAGSIGLPLYAAGITPGGNSAEYGKAMSEAVGHFKSIGVTHFIFGDIFLKGIREYRERQLRPYGITVVEPLWGKTSEEVMDDFLATGLKTVIVAATGKLGADYIGKTIDRRLIDTLPVGTDPNGENGEYHTFCYDGPIFHFPIEHTIGAIRNESFKIRLDNGTESCLTVHSATLSCPNPTQP